MNFTLRPGKPDDANACGQICFDAFTTISKQHNFPPDLPSPEMATGFLTMLLSRPDVYSVVAEAEGKVVGSPGGVHRYTVGQRKGLGLSSPVPLYVVGLDAGANAVTVGPREALDRCELSASGVNWIAGTPPDERIRVTAQIRHRHTEAAATIQPIGDERVSLTFDTPEVAIAPGQALVMYQGEEVLGGGWID